MPNSLGRKKAQQVTADIVHAAFGTFMKGK